MKEKKKGRFLLNILFMQAAVVIYTFSSVANKKAAQQEVMSKPYILFWLLVVFILGVYAVLWQQIIKKFKLSVAYANRSMSILWTMIWSVFIFGETISLQNIIGVVMVIAGVILVNSDDGITETEVAKDAVLPD